MPMRKWRSWMAGFACSVGFAYSLVGCFGEFGAYLEAGPGDGGEAGRADTSQGDTRANEASDVKPGDAPVSEAQPDAQSDAQSLIAAGMLVFFHGTAASGNVGCSTCHGDNGEGKSGLGMNIRGKSVTDIVTCLQTQSAMAFFMYPNELTPTDVQAVAAYLGWLATQPP